MGSRSVPPENDPESRVRNRSPVDNRFRADCLRPDQRLVTPSAGLWLPTSLNPGGPPRGTIHRQERPTAWTNFCPARLRLPQATSQLSVRRVQKGNLAKTSAPLPRGHRGPVRLHAVCCRNQNRLQPSLAGLPVRALHRQHVHPRPEPQPRA
uniref:(northern house mosquito) hypothetical protein n=1 Tax=Culex pipiens TaxID=7175 RepID=A0A8D8AL54_CULPI